MTKHQKHDFDTSAVTTFGMKEEAMKSSASIVICASNASATCVKVKDTPNMTSNQLLEFLMYWHPTST